MKNSTQVISTILATSVIGAALSKLSSAPITAVVNGEVILAVAASAAVVLFAAYDYARRLRSLAPARPKIHASCRFAEEAVISAARIAARVRRRIVMLAVR